MNNDISSPSFFARLKHSIRSFGATEKTVFGIFTLLFIASAFYVLNSISQQYMTEVPVNGGTLEEGVVGYASSINPVLAYTDADKDLTALIYSGLLKATPKGLENDLAESMVVSEDGKTYDVTIKADAKFHDNTPVTADDVVFTIEKIIDPTINSPKAASWSGVTVEKVSDKEVKFTIKSEYAGFVENLTLGIIPKHLWVDIEPALFAHSTLNQEPIGSGPYKIKSSRKNSAGLYEYYDLVPFKGYSLGNAHISHLIIRFFKNEEAAVAAYRNGSINTLGGISPESAASLTGSNGSIMRIPLPRTFAIFFNSSNAPVLLNTEVRQALNMAVDRNALIQDILKGYGAPATGPIPAGFIGEELMPTDTATTSEMIGSIDEARSLLESKGWKANADGIMEKAAKTGTQTLTFSISTSNVPELKRTAEIVAEQWKAIGANVSVQIFEPSDLNQKVIRTRKYDALLFGTAIGRDLDLYPFWHSSQRNFPGLNIALYANIKADKFLQDARGSASSTVREVAYQGFEKEIANDIPAVFLYSPQYIYFVPTKLQNASIANMTSPAERFMTVSDWHVVTEKVWNFFIRQ